MGSSRTPPWLRYVAHANRTRQAHHMGIHMESHVLSFQNTNGHILCCCIPPPSMDNIHTHTISLHHSYCRLIPIPWSYTTHETGLDITYQRDHTQSNSNITPNRSPFILHHPITSLTPSHSSTHQRCPHPKDCIGLPFVNLYPNPTHPLMLQLKRLLVIPLRRSLGLPHNAHHDSIFIETRTLPIPYLQIYHSLLFARRYINQVPSPQLQQERYDLIFKHHPNHDLLASAPMDPLCQLLCAVGP